LLDEISFDEVGDVEPMGSGTTSASVELPQNSGRYRLYAFVSYDGDVATASAPIFVP
jgi:hypothetical protein